MTAPHRVLAALVEHPGSTVAQLARYAQAGESTTSVALGAFEKDGLATRTPGPARGGRTPRAWTATGAGLRRCAENTRPGAPATRVRRVVARGELRGVVERWLNEHPDTEVIPGRLDTALGRLPGSPAVSRTLETLVALGLAARTCEKPRTYQAAPDRAAVKVEWLSLAQVAEELGIPLRRLWNLRGRGRGPRGYTVAGLLLVKRADLDAWRESQPP